MSTVPKIQMTDIEKYNFNEFLKTFYNSTFASWLSFVEPTRTAIYDSFIEYKVNGRFVNASFSPEKWFFGSGDGRKIFSQWLHKSSNISYDCFLTLSLELKQRIYREFCNSSEGRLYFDRKGLDY